MLKILAFDTATDALSVALMVDDGSDNSYLNKKFQMAPQRHAELALSVISELMSQASLSIHQLDAIAFGQGPGSFMGVRIAAGLAQGLAFGADLPVIPVSTLQSLAQMAFETEQSSSVIAAWDARMHEIYWGGYQADNFGFMQPTMAEKLSAPIDLIIPEGDNWCAVGNAWKVYQQQLPEGIFNRFSKINAELYPHAEGIAKIAGYKYRRKEFISATEAQPVYLRDKVTG